MYNLGVPAEKLAFENEIKDKDLWVEGCLYQVLGTPLIVMYRPSSGPDVSLDCVSFRVFTAYIDVYKRDKTTHVGLDKRLEPGAYVGYNDDDDDEDGGGTTADWNDSDIRQDGTPKEDDMMKVTFIFDYYFYYELETGFVVIKRDNTKIKLWKNEFKGGADKEIVFDSAGGTEKVYDLSDPCERYEFRHQIWDEETHQWVEGYQASGGLKDTGLALSYLDPDGVDVCVNSVKITVMTVDLNIDGVADEAETTVGGFIGLNNDDDDNNGTADKDESGPITGEDNLVKITLQKVEPTALTGTVTLKANSGGSKIKVWTSSTKGTEVTLPKTYSTPSELPKDLWVEGYSASTSVPRDVELGLEYVVEGQTFDDEVKFTVVDVDVKEVSFSGTKYHVVKKDDGSVDFAAPHWKDNNLDGDVEDTAAGDIDYPVSYTSSATGADSYMKAAVKMKVAPASSAIFASVQLKAENADGYTFSDSGSLSGSELSFSSGDVQCAKKFDNEKVGYLNPLELTWKFSLDGGTSWLEVIETETVVYVTWKDPEAGMALYETPLKIGCDKANNQTLDTSIISNIWSEFSDCSVKRVGTTADMTYWGGSSPPQLIDGLLSTGDGSCRAWSQLLHWCMKSQGLKSDSQIFEVVPDTSVNSGAYGFLVKNWNFGWHIRTGTDAIRDSTVTPDDVPVSPAGNNSPCILPGPNGNLDSSVSGNDTSQDGLYAGTNYPYEIDKDARDQAGVEAQGNSTPPRAFYSHWVCKIKGDIYDPSYGIGSYSSEVAHENAAIDGIRNTPLCKKNNIVQELTYSHDTASE